MAFIYKAQVVIKAKSGLAKDQYVNNFTFGATSALSGADATDLAELVGEAYHLPQTIGGEARSHIGFHFGSQVAQSGHEVKLYAMSQTPPRVPIEVYTFGLPANPASAGLPGEVALCVSGRAAKTSGTVDARRRGRVYIGPLRVSDITNEATTNKPRPATALITDILYNIVGIGLRAQSEASCQLGTSSSQGAAGNFVPWSEVWVDNAFDTQRRRGDAPTAKTTTSITLS